MDRVIKEETERYLRDFCSSHDIYYAMYRNM